MKRMYTHSFASGVAVMLVLSAIGCDSTFPTVKLELDTASIGEPCLAEVAGTSPVNGATDHYHGAPIVFTLSAPDATATVSGLPGSTAVSSDGLTITFTPDALEWMTSYTVTLDYCGGSLDLSFTTEGEIPREDVEFSGTYDVNLASANITSPPGIGSILGSVLTTPILLGVTEVSDTLEMVGAIGVEGDTTQDYCTASIDFPTATFDDPVFAVGPQDTTIDVSGASIPIGQLEVTGAFASDGSYFGGGTLSGSLDARDIAAAFPDLGYDAQGLCDLLWSFGAVCTDCDDGERLCLDLYANQITADMVSGTLIEVTASDCPGCDVGEPVCA